MHDYNSKQWNGRVVISSGVLTADVLDKALSSVLEHQGQTSQLFISPKLLNDLIAWEALEKWLKSLPPINEKMERLRMRLKNRPKHTVMNLPE